MALNLTKKIRFWVRIEFISQEIEVFDKVYIWFSFKL